MTSKTGVSERARDILTSLAHANLKADRDHMIAGGDDLAWLAAQLTHYPIRVDSKCTTNDRFLRMSAAATILAQQEIIGELVGVLEFLLNNSGARGVYRALNYADAVERAEAALAKAKGVKGG